MERANAENLHNYDIAALSCTTQDYNIAKRIARTIKQKNTNTIVVLGGSHITWLPQTMTRDFDFGVLGEGEQTFVELAEYVNSGCKVEKLFTINGLIFHWDGGIMASPPRALIEPLDNIPPPIRDNPGETMYHMFTSRGCPYKCAFCSSTAFWKKTRFHSADYVVAEIERCVRMGATHIPMMDDLFVANRKRFIEIVEKLKRTDLHKKFNFDFMLQVRANLVDDELCKLMKEFNVRAAHFGAESASDRILNLMGKGVTVAKNQEALDIMHSHGITANLSFIVGWPTETEDELRATFNFIVKNGREGKMNIFSGINVLTPLPGTKVWDDAVKAGIINLDNFDWDRLSIFSPHLTEGGFDAWVDSRRQYNSLYLNEAEVPQEKLYDIIREHDRVIRGAI
jgi:radical SAM superfamily enzyme YgiQ (UPF0313 family)